MDQWRKLSKPVLVDGRMVQTVQTIYPAVGMLVTIEPDVSKLAGFCRVVDIHRVGSSGMVAHVFGLDLVVLFPDGVKAAFDQRVVYPA